ncbi:UbiA-like polyprenyltransferase [Trichloromonas acetexigens]|jgi:4-hydroxybenzoate polyprenyltransferase|uniref:4-hydroxybenzoate polyprenyltransferase n=1 Tax=Trichloromonas acetexigens TaxID=38815 RepID=A0A550JBS6_9BACT|nr:UbiA-like polyprenyltransferase [Desulfuromonas acetexigens]TRO80611.1 4-hydroxybenzoate octaprenyltransferase [Desulfuromonas acetexigens]
MSTAVWFNKVHDLLEMIKFSHTVFAFPFALMGVVFASLASGRAPTVGQVFWVCLAMVGARTAAMSLNRIIDAGIDKDNPRTAGRHIPAGRVSRLEAWLFVTAAVALLLLSAWMLNPLCFYLAPVALGFFVLYAYCKRFTSFAHIVLGICLAAAPIGAWIALRGDVGWPVLVLGVAVLFWVAGFDIFYSLQDVEYDRSKGLHSIPVLLGVKNAILLGKVFHGLMVAFLLIIPLGLPLGWIYYLGLAVVSGLIAYEHQLVKPDDLSRLDAAFFNMNGYISVTIFLFTLVDALAR